MLKIQGISLFGILRDSFITDVSTQREKEEVPTEGSFTGFIWMMMHHHKSIALLNLSNALIISLLRNHIFCIFKISNRIHFISN